LYDFQGRREGYDRKTGSRSDEKHLKDGTVYVPNGVFITAALHCGFRYKAYENFPNPCFNMSEASIKSLEKQYLAL
jgi:hypothetical protein